jgi:beta-glucosidase
VGELGKQQCLGIQSQGVESTLKHFATYSTPNGGRDGKGRTDPQIPFRDMHQILMDPFEKVIKEANPKGVMSSYNTYDGIPVTSNPYFLTELLREQYGFKGYVVSDSGAVSRLEKQHKAAADWETAIVEAVNAGLSVRTNFQDTKKFVLPLRKVVAEGRVSEETINSRVEDVLRVKFELGLFDKPYVEPEKTAEIIHIPEHEATTLEAARKAIVLLKNDGILPLDGSAYKTILATGPCADDVLPMISRYGPGASDVISPVAGLKEYFGDKAEILHAKGCHYFDKLFPKSDVMPSVPDEEAQAQIDEALELAEKS